MSAARRTSRARHLRPGLFFLFTACLLASSLRAPGQGLDALLRPAEPAYDVVALRVEFQPDSSRFTTGDGTFGEALYDGLDVRIDPLPHDAAYFQAHLAFLENYVARVSDGRTRVTTHLIPEVVRVSGRMAAYAPTGPEADSDAEQAKLAALVDEAWTLADAQSSFDLSGFDPATTAYVLFHAGAGRDLELVGAAVNLNKTPEDLPSLYFGADRLRDLLGGELPRFKGRSIDNTLLLPETESRLGIDPFTDTPFVLELSINGLLAASFFNYLGVPDLFNTADGQSAIGPLGLMDPLGFFAYGGLFPPEPSGWTKYALGWTEPVVLDDDGPVEVALQAVGLTEGTQAAVAPVSESEYFLLENRHRDPGGNGLSLTYYKDGDLRTQRFEAGQEGFTAFDQSAFEGGVVVSVDNYDWALPDAEAEDGTRFDGGIVIWHVDENRMRAGWRENRVNADPRRRALDVEEADGAQDFGFPPGNPFAARIDLGTPFDLWFLDNPATAVTESGQEVRFYQNRFGSGTEPSSATNAGGASFLVLENFSAPGSEMRFTYTFDRAGTAGVVPLPARPSPGSVAPDVVVFNREGVLTQIELHGTVLPVVVIPLPEGKAAIWVDGAVLEFSGRVPAPVLPVSVEIAGRADPALAAFTRNADGADPALTVVDPLDGTILDSWPLPASVADLEPLGRLIARPNEPGRVIVPFRSETGGVVVEAGPDGTTSRTYDAAPVQDVVLTPDGRVFVFAVGAAADLDDASRQWTFSGVPGVAAAAGGIDREGLILLTLTTENRLLILEEDRPVLEIDLPDTGPLGRPVPADLDGDGLLDVLLTVGKQVYGYARTGGIVRGYPKSLPVESETRPLLLTLAAEDQRFAVISGVDGYLYRVPLDGAPRSHAAFPLAVGTGLAATPVFGSGRLFAVTTSGAVRGWRIDDAEPAGWSGPFGDARHTGSLRHESDGGGTVTEGIIDRSETYNWPNPVRDGLTHLRIGASVDCRVEFTIVDLAGALVDRVTVDQVRAGLPTEYAWRTDAPSGVYHVRVRATGIDGASDTHHYTIAVIR